MIVRSPSALHRSRNPITNRMTPRIAHARWLVAAAVVGAIFSMQPIASAQYPPCNPQEPGCAMQQQGIASNTTGPIDVYVLLYGANFANGGNDGYTYLAIERLVFALIDSSFENAITTYTNIDPGQVGFTNLLDSGYSQGKTISDTNAVTNAIAVQIRNGNWPADPNAVYMFVPDSTVKVTITTPQFCPNGQPGTSCACGANDSWIYNGQRLKWAMVTNSLSTPGCQYHTHTPNDSNGADANGAIDLELASFAHELNEALTAQWTLNPATVAQYNLGHNNQMADFCAGQTRDTYNVLTSSGVQALADFHGYNSDFLLQAYRVNENSGSFGYCASGYGGVFWGRDSGLVWSPLSANGGDWSPGNYKGECENGQSLLGVSTYVLGIGQAHSVMCGDGQHSADLQQSGSCHTVNYAYYGGDTQGSVQGTSQQKDVWWTNGDWDPGYYKGECGANEFMAGVAQQTNGRAASILCCPGSANILHSACETVAFDSSNFDNPSNDWDYGYYKASCPLRSSVDSRTGRYAAGISDSTDNLTPHRLLCCYRGN
jgi:hypothetical protein